MNSNIKTAVFWVVLICVAVLLFAVVRTGQGRKEQQLTFTEFMDKVQQSQVKDVTISGNEVHGSYQNPNQGFHTLIPANYPDVYKTLQDKGVNVDIKDASSGNWISILLNASPFIVLIAFWIFMMRQMQSGGNKALSFGKSRARLHSTQQKKVTFKDVAGVEEAKEELQEIIEFLREPQKFQKLGGRIPKGVLLIGPPGTGKTLLARAIAGEASVPFFSISGSDFVEMFVGVGASRVRDLFEQGKKNAPCIIFIDEIDAVGRHRGAGLGGGHDEREQTLNQLLVEMDGFESNEGVILVAATNRPDVQGREAILRVHTKKIPLGDNVDLSVLARGTPGLAGADLANLVNEAALNAARQNRKVVMMTDFETAKDKILMGAERKSLILSDAEKKNTAYHEAGHALVAALLPNADPLHKVTIIPRGMALGVTMQLPIDDKHSYNRDYLLAQLAILMAGRIAEEKFMHHMTTGAGNDIERATDMARKMVCEWGMSELGPLSFGKKEEQIFLGREIAQHRDYSEETAIRIDEQVKKLVQGGYDTAANILEQRSEALVKIAEALLVREILDGNEVMQIINGETLPPLPASGSKDSEDHTQKVLRPEGGRRAPGFSEGERPQPA